MEVSILPEMFSNPITAPDIFDIGQSSAAVLLKKMSFETATCVHSDLTMKSATSRFLLTALVLTCCGMLAQAGVVPDDGEMRCSADHNRWSKNASFAEVREERFSSAPVNYIDPGQNGSIRVHGWNDNNVRVKACVQTSAPTEAEAHELATEVRATKGAGHIEASGPENQDRRNWSVSYEIWLPAHAEIRLKAFNGSIAIEGVDGRVRFETLNGSVKLADAGGDVSGETTNGSLAISVKEGIDTGTLHLVTTNGSVHLELPDNFSARVQASTTNGNIHTDFPVTVSGTIGKQVQFTLGTGGPEIEARTTNGSIHISKRK